MRFELVLVPVLLASFSEAKYGQCLLRFNRGNCRFNPPRWSYIYSTDKCIPVISGRCAENRNNFWTKEACELTCG
uniref:BPTI/Kunitz inhibitor domain-containing protein n=1 Tax=Mesocestoides corti TaxID=53468 RepID=A0A5K3FXH2_MESCO